MIKQNPFSLYDFLGYFIPGALLIYIYLFIEYFNNLKIKFNLLNFLNDNQSFQTEKFLFFIIISYALGHMINFLSSITVEKYANWIYDYPSKYLLGLVKNRIFWKSLNLRRIITALIIFPVMFFDLILGNLFKFKNFYTRKLDTLLIQIIKEKGLILIKQLYQNNIGNKEPLKLRDNDFHRIFTHYTFENSKNHQFKLVNYVVLYGFLRALTLISILIFWYLVYLKLFKNNEFICYYHFLIIGFISYTFFMAFIIFYRRYTLEGFMLIAIDKELK